MAGDVTNVCVVSNTVGISSMMTGHDNVCVASNTIMINRMTERGDYVCVETHLD